MDEESKAIVDEMTADWAVWSIILRGWATYSEIANDWTINELMDAHEMLKTQTALENVSRRRQELEAKASKLNRR